MYQNNSIFEEMHKDSLFQYYSCSTTIGTKLVLIFPDFEKVSYGFTLISALVEFSLTFRLLMKGIIVKK